MSRRKPFSRDVPMWDVVVEAHDVVTRRGRRLAVARKVVRLGCCVDDADALRVVVGWAHADSGVPPWRPFVRQSLAHARVSRYMVEVV